MQNHRSKKKPYANIAPRYQTGDIVKKSKIDKDHPHWTLNKKIEKIQRVMDFAEKAETRPWSEIPIHNQNRYFNTKGVPKRQPLSPAEKEYLPKDSPWLPFLKSSK